VLAVDGIARDRERRQKAMALIASDPRYFASIYWLRVERLLGYTQQNRPVPLEIAPTLAAHSSLAFYRELAPRNGVLWYYSANGHLWDYLRPWIAMLQRLFVTPLVLALAACGLLVALAWNWRVAVFMLVLPAYYIGLQALMWAEFRHTLPVHIAVFVFVGVAAHAGWNLLRAAAGAIRRR
jgi:hypothetical protein